MRTPVSTSLCLAVLATLVALLAPPLAAQTQQPGDYPRLTISDAAGQAPAPGAPFDNSGVLTVSGGTSMSLDLTYLSEGPANDMVPWAILLSPAMTGMPLDQVPPPLYTLPPFKVIFPPGLFLDPDGSAGFFTIIPASLTSGTVFLQALVRDLDSFPNLKLSNGVAVTASPPRYNAAFSFARAAAAFDEHVIEGVGSRDLGIDQLNTFPPLGAGTAPDSSVTGVFPEGVRFVPIVPTGIEGAVMPLARPSTRVATPITGAATNELVVDDTSGFPPEGKLAIQFGSDNPWGNKTQSGADSPDVEVIAYTGITPTSFTGLTRNLIGSEGASAYPHQVGDIVLGDFTWVSSPHILSRDRVGYDVRNADLPRVTLPAFSFEPPVDPDGGDPEAGFAGEPEPVTRELDLLRYRVDATGDEGFAVLDHRTHEYELIEGTQFAAADGLSWDPVVTVTPDHRAFLAVLRADTGISANFKSDPDRLFAIRLDGLDWPASDSPVWEIDFELADPPAPNDDFVRAAEVVSRSMIVLNTDPENFIAYVGLNYKFAKTLGIGDANSVSAQGSVIANEATYAREDLRIRDLIEIPLIPPGSEKSPPVEPRPWINDDFPPLGNQLSLRRFDPEFVRSPAGDQLAIAAGVEIKNEDVYVIRGALVNQDGTVSRLIQNITGFGSLGAPNPSNAEIRSTNPNGGSGHAGRMVFSPEGTRVAFIEFQNARRDWLGVARTNGVDYGNVGNIYSDGADTAPSFIEAGPYQSDHAILLPHWVDEDRLIFFMGVTSLFDPLQIFAMLNPATDLFVYDANADLMTNLTKSGGATTGFDVMGAIQPLAAWMSDDGAHWFVLRHGPITGGNTVIPPGTTVTNLLAVDRETLEVRDVTGDEYTDAASLPNLILDDTTFPVGYEVPPRMQFTRGRGVQADLVWFAGVDVQDETETEQVFSFRESAAGLGFQATSNTLDGSRVSNITPSRFSGKLAYARTGDDDLLAATQHPYLVDLDNFLFEIDLAAAAEMGGVPFGRVMDGSFHFVQPTGEASEALAYVFGMDVAGQGIATDTAAFYVPLRNISNPVLLPEPILLPLLDDAGLGVGSRLYLTSAGPSEAATPLGGN